METSGKQNRRLIATEALRMRNVIDALLASPSPTGAISQLIAASNMPGTPVFERYAGLALQDAGARKLMELPPARAVRLAPPGSGHLARLSSAHELGDDEHAAVTNTESAINRLCDMVNAIEDSRDFLEDPRVHAIHLSIYGNEPVTQRPSYRSANVTLPAIRQTEKPTLAYLNEVDWRMLDHVAAIGKSTFQQCLTPNKYQSIMGAYARSGSDWDMRTRLAKILDMLELSLHVEPRFDCNAITKSVSIRFAIPARESFPQRCAAQGGDGLVPCTCLDDARLVYTLRLSCLYAAACFGSGRHIERAFVAAEELGADGTRTVASCTFTRATFARNAFPVIESGELSSRTLRFDPHGVADIIGADAVSFADLADSASCVDDPDDTMSAIRIPVHLDTRELPEYLQKQFRTRRICDIDTSHPYGSNVDTVKSARADSSESAIAAIAQLESVIEALEAEAVPPDDDAESRPLHCSDPLSRAVVSLLDDDLGVSVEAEAFLHGEVFEAIPQQHLPRFFRAPSSLFDAHLGLSHLYEHLGDMHGAEAEANRCIALAPTTVQAYQRKADVLAQQQRFGEAARIIMAGLTTVASTNDAALLYYHLALLFWNLDRKRDAAAIMVYTTALSGKYAAKAREAVRSLRKRKDGPVIASASPFAATREMSQSHIPIAPREEAKVLVVKAAIGLSCANAPEAAAPYASAIAHYFRDDPIISTAARSIVFGTN